MSALLCIVLLSLLNNAKTPSLIWKETDSLRDPWKQLLALIGREGQPQSTVTPSSSHSETNYILKALFGLIGLLLRSRRGKVDSG